MSFLAKKVTTVVRDEQTAERAAELALLSAVVHGGGPDAAEIGKAALFWAREDERAPLYADLVFASVNQAAWVVLEGLTANGNYEYQSDFAKRYVTQGRTRGRNEGRAEGQAHAILGVLAARGIAVSGAGARAHLRLLGPGATGPVAGARCDVVVGGGRR
jgi:hypothetical protein